MHIVVSPAKKLDFDSDLEHLKLENTRPTLLGHTSTLIKELQTYKSADIKKLMKLSDSLADLNFDRFQDFKKFKSARPAVFAFMGDTYKGLNVATYNKNEIKYAQKHLNILSGLYGILKPLDEIKPYRLEMGTRLKVDENKNLYDFWGSTIVDELNKNMKNSKSKYLINLASEEYFKSVKLDELDGELINIKFLENKNGVYKTIGLMSKRARGMMATFIIKNKVKTLDELKNFNIDGYKFNKSESKSNLLVFKR